MKTQIIQARNGMWVSGSNFEPVAQLALKAAEMEGARIVLTTRNQPSANAAPKPAQPKSKDDVSNTHSD